MWTMCQLKILFILGSLTNSIAHTPASHLMRGTALIFDNIQELALHGLWCQFYHWVIKSVDDGNMRISRMLFSNIEYQWVQWNEAHQLYGGDGLAPLWLPVAVELQLKVTRMTLQTKETQQSAGMRPQHKLQQPLKVTNMSNRNSPSINHELSFFILMPTPFRPILQYHFVPQEVKVSRYSVQTASVQHERMRK